VFDRNDTFEYRSSPSAFFKQSVKTDWFERLNALHFGDIARRGLFTESGHLAIFQLVQKPGGQRTGAGFVDATDESVRISRVNDVGRLFDDVAITPLNPVTLYQTRYLHQ